MVNFKKLVEAGRVAYIASGPDAKKVALIVEIIDQNRVLIDGPCSGVARQAISLKRLHLTKLSVQLPHGCGTASVRKVWEKNRLTEKWESTVWAKKLLRKSLRAKMSDFDRFKLMVARQQSMHEVTDFKVGA
ncbi:unnamed protein product [Dicrocoelium dendriticum]|nr:unnamed protein product [Dicrocoelium dendriticum]